MYVSYGLKYALFGVTGSRLSGRSVKSVRSRLFESVGQVGSVRSIGAVWRRLVSSDVGLSLRPSSYVDLSLRPSILVGLSWLALTADNADLGLY